MASQTFAIGGSAANGACVVGHRPQLCQTESRLILTPHARHCQVIAVLVNTMFSLQG
jgi:hypothetical protein